MLLLCAAATAAVHFATLEGQVTPCDIRSTTYMHYVTLTEEAFWGQRYWDLVWVVPSEMERRACVYVEECV